jgi:iron complex outermembrane receptor protein
VRTPNYIEQNLQNTLLPAFPASLNGAPLFPRLINNRDLLSEDLLAYELGYRAQATDTFSYDLALFYNVYDNLSTARPGKSFLDPLSGSFLLPTIRENGLNAESYGAELAANWRLTECWRVYGNYTWLQINTHRAAGLPESAEAASEGQSPHHQVYLQSSWDLPHHLELDLIGRYVDRLPGFAKVVQSYFSLDARLGWKPRPNLEIAVVGQNLLDSTHLETGAIALVPFPLIEVPRGVYGTVTLRW